MNKLTLNKRETNPHYLIKSDIEVWKVDIYQIQSYFQRSENFKGFCNHHDVENKNEHDK